MIIVGAVRRISIVLFVFLSALQQWAAASLLKILNQHNARLVERIARNGLPADMELKENSVVEFTAPNGGTFSGFLRELDGTHALFDFNHPMAGKAIRFEVKIIGIM